MTRQELSEQANISISFISDLTNGKANPSLRIMEQIAKTLDTPLPVLLSAHDLGYEFLRGLEGDDFNPSIPHGHERVTAILPKQQAFVVKKWAAEAKKRVRKQAGGIFLSKSNPSDLKDAKNV